MKIEVYTLSKNEIDLCPFFVDYWKAYSDDVTVYVYDGMSTDGTREYLSQYPWIHIIDWEIEGGLNDDSHKNLKNECWKNSNADFVICCDFDEALTALNGNIRDELENLKNAPIIIPLSFNIVCDKFPKYEDGKFLHELCEYGFNDYQWFAKPIIFNPKKIKEYNTCHGGHWALPEFYNKDDKFIYSTNLFLIHAKYVGFDFFRKRLEQRVMSDWNMKIGYTGEKIEDKEKQEQYYIDKFNEVKVKQLFNWFDISSNLTQYYETIVDWRYWKINMLIKI